MWKAPILQRNKDDKYTVSPFGSSKPTWFIKARRLSQNPGIRYIATGKSQGFSGSDLATCRINLNSGITLQVPSRAPTSDDDMSGIHHMVINYTLRSIGLHFTISCRNSPMVATSLYIMHKHFAIAIIRQPLILSWSDGRILNPLFCLKDTTWQLSRREKNIRSLQIFRAEGFYKPCKSTRHTKLKPLNSKG